MLNFSIMWNNNLFVHQLKSSGLSKGFECQFGNSILDTMISNNRTPSASFERLRKTLQKELQLGKFVIDHNPDYLKNNRYFFLIEMMMKQKIFKLKGRGKIRFFSLFTKEFGKVFCCFWRKISIGRQSRLEDFRFNGLKPFMSGNGIGSLIKPHIKWCISLDWKSTTSIFKMLEIYSQIQQFKIKKSDFLSNLINKSIRVMQDCYLILIVCSQSLSFCNHLTIHIRSNDFEVWDWPFACFMTEKILRMTSMSKSPIKTQCSVCRHMIVDFWCKDWNMAEHSQTKKINCWSV